MTGETRVQKVRTLNSRRVERVCSWLADFRNDLAKRLLEPRKLFKDQALIIDPHTHSEYSDGSAAIPMNRDAGKPAGIDLVFATGYGSRRQKHAVS